MTSTGIDTAAVKLAGARHPTMQHGTRWMRFIVGTGLAFWGLAVVISAVTASFNVLGVVWLVPLLIVATRPLARRIARTDADPKMYALVMTALTAKLLGAAVRYFVAEALYGSVGDANEYDAYGQFLGPSYRHLDFSPNVGKLTGTGFLKAVTGVLYAIQGNSKLGGFVVFSFLAFLGLLLLWRAFKLAVPHGDHYRYAVLVFFLPSLLYWPSALGKDAWMVMGLGMVSYGVASFLNRSIFIGAAFFVPGLIAITLVRPHVSLVVFAGLLLAALLAKPKRPTPASPLIRVATFGVLWVLLLILLAQTSAFLGVQSLDQETVNTQLTSAEGRTDEANSTFTPVRMDSPATAPYAIVTVLFRPFPWEAHNGQSFLTTVESGVLLVLTVRGWRRLRAISKYLRKEAYIAYAIGVVFAFCFAFSSFSNFGILARQRCQVMPFFIVLICMQPYRRPDPVHEASIDDLAIKPIDPYAGLAPTENPYAIMPGPHDPYAIDDDGADVHVNVPGGGDAASSDAASSEASSSEASSSGAASSDASSSDGSAASEGGARERGPDPGSGSGFWPQPRDG